MNVEQKLYSSGLFGPETTASRQSYTESDVSMVYSGRGACLAIRGISVNTSLVISWLMFNIHPNVILFAGSPMPLWRI